MASNRSSAVVARWHGRSRAGAAARLAEAVHDLDELFGGGRVNGFRLSQPPDPRPTITVAAFGPNAVEAAQVQAVHLEPAPGFQGVADGDVVAHRVFAVDPGVPGLGVLAREELDQAHGIVPIPGGAGQGRAAHVDVAAPVLRHALSISGWTCELWKIAVR